MSYQIVYPFSYVINGETMKDAIKNYAKYNYDMNIHKLIVTDKINHMKAKMEYYSDENNNKKVKISMKPTFWNGVGFDSHNRLRVPGTEWPSRTEVNFDSKPTIPDRALFYEPQPQPLIQPVLRTFVQPVVQPFVQPVVQPVVQPFVQPVVRTVGQPYIYAKDNYMEVASSNPAINGPTKHYVNVPGTYGTGLIMPLLQKKTN